MPLYAKIAQFCILPNIFYATQQRQLQPGIDYALILRLFTATALTYPKITNTAHPLLEPPSRH
jgi:hypothetical protein